MDTIENEILQPLQEFKDELKDKHKQLTEEYFDKLVEESGVDPEENARIMEERRKTLEKLKDADKYVRRKKSLRGFVIFCTILLFVLGAIFFVYFGGAGGSSASTGTPDGGANTTVADMTWLAYLLLIVCVLAAIGLIVVICVVINKKIKAGNSIVEELTNKVNELESEAWAQMRPLNVKFDWNMPDQLIYQTVPQIQLDKYFDIYKQKYFYDNFGLSVAGRDDVSVFCARSGNSCGNPFLLIRYLMQDFVAQTYTGSLTVTWEERVVRSDGSVSYVTKSQTLYASVQKPKPNYTFATYLYYGNDAAPDLSFSRGPIVPIDASDKKIASMVKSGEKQLEKKARDAVKNGTSYNKLANSEFEVLFGADDRDNEMQFRMMFTPLAQTNMVKLLRSKEPYGDDFAFEKRGKENIIYSRHGADLDIDANPARFVDFDFAKVRRDFISYNMEYFKSLYFDFAPLFSIPIYQQERPENPFTVCNEHELISDWEMEAVANFFKYDLLNNRESVTTPILKVAPLKDDEEGCLAQITAHAFRGEERVDYVSVYCNNGNYYDVAVPWIEYIPVREVTNVYMKSVNMTREQFLETEESGSDSIILVSGVKAHLMNK